MSQATRVIHWDGEQGAEMLQELRGLPPGRYILVPANQPAGVDVDLELTPEQCQGLEEALERFRQGEPAITMDEYFEKRAARRSARTP